MLSVSIDCNLITESNYKLLFQINNTEKPDEDELLQKVRKDRGYSYEDQITCSREKLPDYDNKVRDGYFKFLTKNIGF